MVYFDDIELNFGSRLTGEARFVHEVNSGIFGDDMELVLDRTLSLTTKRVYRFVNRRARIQYRSKQRINNPRQVRHRTNDSPLP